MNDIASIRNMRPCALSWNADLDLDSDTEDEAGATAAGLRATTSGIATGAAGSDDFLRGGNLLSLAAGSGLPHPEMAMKSLHWSGPSLSERCSGQGFRASC